MVVPPYPIGILAFEFGAGDFASYQSFWLVPPDTALSVLVPWSYSK